MTDVLEAYSNLKMYGGVYKIKEILTYKRLFFLCMDKKSNKIGSVNFIQRKKRMWHKYDVLMKPLFFEAETDKDKKASCVKVCLSERSAYYGNVYLKEFYSAISSKDLLRLCKISEVDPDFTLIFAIRDSNNDLEIPIKAGELVPILSKRKFLVGIRNFFKSKMGHAYLFMDAVFLVIFGIFFFCFKVHPAIEAAAERAKTEERRVSTIKDGNREFSCYDEHGHIFRIIKQVKEHSDEYDKKEGWLSYTNTNSKYDRGFSYDSDGKLIHEKENYESIGYTLHFNPDKKEPVNESGVKEEIWYEYDSNGNLVLKSYNDGTQEKYKYDKNGNMIYSESSDQEKTTYEYDEQGILISSKTESGLEIKYEYDEDGKLIHIESSDGSEEKFQYQDGNLFRHIKIDSNKDYTSNTYYEYDENNNLITEENKAAKEKWFYSYDENNRKIYEKLEKYEWAKDKRYKYILEEAWYTYELKPDGTVDRVIKYF